MKSQKRKWEQAVDYSCVHAFHAAGFDSPDSFKSAKVSDLLLVQEVDANNVASLLAFFYGENNKWRKQINHKPNFNISKAELASDIKDISEYYEFDTHPDWLQNITVKDFLELDGIDEVTIPSMVRKIKHLLRGAAEPFDTSPMPLKSCRREEVTVSTEQSELTWAQQDALLNEPDEEGDFYDGMGEYQPPVYMGGLVHAW